MKILKIIIGFSVKATRWMLRNASKIISKTFTNMYNNHIRKQKENDKILFIPCAVLNGSFGDELMIVAFLEINKGKSITLYCSKIIERKDLFENYGRLEQLSQNIIPMYKQYNGGVFLMGADIMTGAYDKKDVLTKCAILKNANKYKLRTSILGFSFHDISEQKIKKSMENLLPQTIFNLRERDSYNVAKQFLPESNLRLVADMAFLCPSTPNNDLDYLLWIEQQHEMNKIIVGVCPNALQANLAGKDYYITEYISLLEYMNNRHNLSFVLLYHDIREHTNDLELSEKIHAGLPDSMNLFYTKNICNGIQLKSYLNHIDFTLTGRLHFGISGYSLGKPMFGIGYEGKFSGIQKLFGIDPEKSIIDYRKLNDSMAVMDMFMENLSNFFSLVNEKLPVVLKMAEKNFEV